FKEFILRGNVVELGVAVVMGAAFGTVVSAFVKDLLTPLLAAAGRKPDFSNLVFTFNGSQFRYGDFVNAVIAFLLIALAVYYVIIVPYSRLKKSAPPQAPNTRACPECLSEVPLQARRCSHCAQPISPVSPLRTG